MSLFALIHRGRSRPIPVNESPWRSPRIYGTLSGPHPKLLEGYTARPSCSILQQYSGGVPSTTPAIVPPKICYCLFVIALIRRKYPEIRQQKTYILTMALKTFHKLQRDLFSTKDFCGEKPCIENGFRFARSSRVKQYILHLDNLTHYRYNTLVPTPRSLEITTSHRSDLYNLVQSNQT